jgi:hypothetical protein
MLSRLRGGFLKRWVPAFAGMTSGAQRAVRRQSDVTSAARAA